MNDNTHVNKFKNEIDFYYILSKAIDNIKSTDQDFVKINFSDFSDFQISEEMIKKIPQMTLEDNFELKFWEDQSNFIQSNEINAENNDSTSTSDQRQKNIDLLNEFNKKNKTFIYLIHHTIFEDGYENEAIKFFKNLYERDQCISLLWLNGIYSESQNDSKIIEGILRIISILENDDYLKYVLPIVKASFNSKEIKIQEAAIMVAEKWRNKMCLDALKTTEFASKWIKDYATQIIEELEEELLK